MSVVRMKDVGALEVRVYALDYIIAPPICVRGPRCVRVCVVDIDIVFVGRTKGSQIIALQRVGYTDAHTGTCPSAT